MTRRPETMAERRARRGAVDDPATVLEAAARFLGARPRSTAEMRRHLVGAGYRPELVEEAIARLAALGYLDDEAFARTWVESRDRARPRGERALRAELRLKGVAAGDVEAALEAREAAHASREAAATGADDAPSVRHADGERARSRISDDEAASRLLGRRDAALLREPDRRRRRAKAYALLARNGFDPDVAGRAVTEWMAGAEPVPEE